MATVLICQPMTPGLPVSQTDRLSLQLAVSVEFLVGYLLRYI